MSPPSESAAAPPPVLPWQAVVDACVTPWGLDRLPVSGGAPSGGAMPCLLFDVRAAADAPGEVLARTAGRLRELPCPVIAVGAALPPVLRRGVDAVVDDAPAARPLLANIRRCPLAAMTLVQLLRHNEESTPEAGLLAESLAYATLQGGPEFAAARAAGLSAPVAVDAGPPLQVERRGDELHIQLHRPGARNAYNTAMRDALFDALQLPLGETGIVRVVLSAAGDCFSVGGDLNEFGRVGDGATAHAIRSQRNVPALLLAVAPRLECQLHSACIGAGIELPAFASRVVARADTFVQLPEIGFGLLPGAGGSVGILQRIGRQRLAWLALSGRRITAATALEWGLVDAVV